MPTPAPPLCTATLWTIVLSYTPALLGSVVPSALWEGSVMPQSSALSRETLRATTLPYVGPVSSVSRIPPTLSWTKLRTTLEELTPCRCSASPQSPGSSPCAAHCGGEAALGVRSLLRSSLRTIRRSEVALARMPSALAFCTVNPRIDEPADDAPVT